MERVDLHERFLERNAWIAASRLARARFAHKAFFRHEGYEVLAIVSGTCSEQVNNRRYLLEKGDLLFIAEGEYHAMTVPEKCEIVFINCRPDRIFSHPDMLALFLRPFQSGLTGGSHRISKRPALFSETLKLADLAKDRPGETFALTKAIMGWLGRFPGKGSKLSLGMERYREALRPAVDLIFGLYDKPLTADSLARACAMSRMTFYRRFQAVYHRHPKRFLNDVRLGRALDQLSFTDRKISVIAEATGFQNLSNFNRAFKRRFQKSPGEARRIKDATRPSRAGRQSCRPHGPP